MWLLLSTLRDFGIHPQHDIGVLGFERLAHALRFLQNLADHRLRALDVAGAFAIRAGRAERPLERLLHALARNRHQPEIVELQNLVRRAVGPHGFFERQHHLLAILALVHIDEVDHDDAAEIAQTDLPHDLLDRIGS